MIRMITQYYDACAVAVDLLTRERGGSLGNCDRTGRLRCLEEC